MKAFGVVRRAGARAFVARRHAAPSLACARLECATIVQSSDHARCLTSGASNPSTFMSSHYQHQDPAEIHEFLRRKQLASRETDTHFVVRECPFCHPTRGKADNLFKLYVHKSKGVYKCHRCGSSGSWLDFKAKVTTDCMNEWWIFL